MTSVTGHLLEPVRSRFVLRGSCSARDLPVRDVADERMPEHVLRLPPERRQPRRPEELLAGELVKAAADLVRAPSSHGLERAGPEDLADDGGVLEHRLPVGRQRVEPRGDDALDGVGQRQVLRRSDFEEQPHVLLGIQGIAACPLEQGGLSLCWKDSSLEQPRDESCGFV